MTSQRTSSTRLTSCAIGPITPSEFPAWRARLISEQRRMVGDLVTQAHEIMPSEHVSISSNHLAEVASDVQEQDVSDASAIEEGILLRLIERAVAKIDSGRPLPYGICEWTKSPIARERLELIPWTPLSAEGAEYMEAQGLRIDDLLERE